MPGVAFYGKLDPAKLSMSHIVLETTEQKREIYIFKGGIVGFRDNMIIFRAFTDCQKAIRSFEASNRKLNGVSFAVVLLGKGEQGAYGH